jgi:hypothetical protein
VGWTVRLRHDAILPVRSHSDGYVFAPGATASRAFARR